MLKRLSLLALLLLATPAYGAVAFDAYTSSSSGTGDISFDHVPVGTARGLIVYVITNAEGDEITTVTADGTDVPEVTDSPALNTTGEDGGSHCFFLGSGIPAGTLTIAVTTSGTATTKIAGAITLTADQDTSVVDTGSLVSNSTSTTSLTLSLGSVASFCAIGSWAGLNSPGNATPKSSWTERMEIDYGNQIGLIYTYDTVDATDVLAGYDNSGGDDTALHAIAIRENAAAGGTAPQGIVVKLLEFLCPSAYAEEVVYRMSKETHDRWLKEGLAWWHYWGQPKRDQDPEDFLIEKASWGRLNSLKEAGITREVIP